MTRFRAKTRPGSRLMTRQRTMFAAFALATATAAFANPWAGAATPARPAAVAGTKTAAVEPGTPKIATPAVLGAHKMPLGKRGSTPQQPVPAAGAKATPQTADGADPGPGKGDGPAGEYDLPVTYHGGQDSAGVVIGPPKVYLVVWGSQWGTPSTNATGDVVLSQDPDQAVPYQQDFFKGLGSAGDGWSAVLTQYCEGIQAGAVQCPAGAAHVPYPKPGSVLAGVWVDNAAAAPQSANEVQLGQEAAAAAQHFGNTTEAQNRNVQYVIDSPQGTDPDSWRELGYCAWHDYEKSSFGQLAYTNMPYLTDVAGCGTNWFGENTARGRLDGYGIIGGHEYAETVTDPNTPGGWTDATGQEIGDKCAWIPMGENGGLFYENLSTGTFPLQTLWSNIDHLCMATDPIYTDPPVSLSTMCDRTDPPGAPVSIPAVAADSSGDAVTYSATGLPPGLAIDSSTGVISGTPAATNNYVRITVTATDTAGKSTSTGFWEDITAGGQHGCSAIEQLTDPGFENGSATVNNTSMTGAWSPSSYNLITPSSLHAPHSGMWYAWLGQNTDDSITTGLNTYPGKVSASLSFWLDVESTNTSASNQDTLSLVAVDQYNNQTLGTVKTWTNLDAGGGYKQQSLDLSPFIAQVGWGTTIELKFVSHETGSTPATAFLIDDASALEY